MKTGLMPIADALANMLAVTSAINSTEEVSLFDASKRILANDLISPVNVPPVDNSAMDGYAFNSMSDLSKPLILMGKVLAGATYDRDLQVDECVRITTGAPIPNGADVVEMQENTEAISNQVSFLQSVRKGQNIRQAGEDISQDSTVIASGTELSPAHLSLIASIGISKVIVTRKIRVALIATGDELVEPDGILQPGQIYESNRYALHALLSENNIDIIHFGIIKDDPKRIKQALKAASEQADLVITCGGVSVGDADYIKQVLDEIGQINFWKVAIKPGKPFAFGTIGKAIFCGLPGNPVSSYVTFETLVLPVLNRLSGQKRKTPMLLKATASENFYKRPGRTDFQRSICFLDDSGNLMAKPNGKQGSGLMTSVANANCYVVLEQQQSNVPKGSQVQVQLF